MTIRTPLVAAAVAASLLVSPSASADPISLPEVPKGGNSTTVVNQNFDAVEAELNEHDAAIFDLDSAWSLLADSVDALATGLGLVEDDVAALQATVDAMDGGTTVYTSARRSVHVDPPAFPDEIVLAEFTGLPPGDYLITARVDLVVEDSFNGTSWETAAAMCKVGALPRADVTLISGNQRDGVTLQGLVRVTAGGATPQVVCSNMGGNATVSTIGPFTAVPVGQVLPLE